MSTPAPSCAIMASAISSCCRQSQRSDPKTSPVRHCEWIRTNGGFVRTLPSPKRPPLPCWKLSSGNSLHHPTHLEIRRYGTCPSGWENRPTHSVELNEHS